MEVGGRRGQAEAAGGGGDNGPAVCLRGNSIF